jgi:hypothetical protein
MPRQKTDPKLKKVQIGIKLPVWLIEALSKLPYSRAVALEHAAIKAYKLKPPA